MGVLDRQELGEEAGGEAREEAGEQARGEAGEQAGEEAGGQAGEEAGKEAGKEAGEEAGEEVGSKTVGEQATLMATPGTCTYKSMYARHTAWYSTCPVSVSSHAITPLPTHTI